MEIDLVAIQGFAERFGILGFMNSPWGWPTAESIHFLGLSLLIGTVGVFDLRMLGVGKGIPISALHKLVPFGIAGYCLNVTTGIMFVSSAPDQYLYNPAFQMKLAFMLIAGLNMLLFYSTTYSAMASSTGISQPQSEVPARAATMAAISLLSWSAVIVCGRLITYYRPPYHWCLWC